MFHNPFTGKASNSVLETHVKLKNGAIEPEYRVYMIMCALTLLYKYNRTAFTDLMTKLHHPEQVISQKTLYLGMMLGLNDATGKFNKSSKNVILSSVSGTETHNMTLENPVASAHPVASPEPISILVSKL
jgi:hypothetical protein